MSNNSEIPTLETAVAISIAFYSRLLEMQLIGFLLLEYTNNIFITMRTGNCAVHSVFLIYKFNLWKSNKNAWITLFLLSERF